MALSVEEARRRLMARKAQRRTPLLSQSQWLNIQARKQQPSEHPHHAWRAEFADMAKRGLSKREVIEEMGLPWSTIQCRLQVLFNGYAEWPPRGMGD